MIVLLIDAYAGPLTILAAIAGASLMFWLMDLSGNRARKRKIEKNFQKTHDSDVVKETFPAFAAMYGKQSNAFSNTNLKSEGDMAEDVKKVLITLKVPASDATKMVAQASKEKVFETPTQMLEYIFKRWGHGHF
jgi:hypothetical protein